MHSRGRGRKFNPCAALPPLILLRCASASALPIINERRLTSPSPAFRASNFSSAFSARRGTKPLYAQTQEHGIWRTFSLRRRRRHEIPNGAFTSLATTLPFARSSTADARARARHQSEMHSCLNLRLASASRPWYFSSRTTSFRKFARGANERCRRRTCLIFSILASACCFLRSSAPMRAPASGFRSARHVRTDHWTGRRRTARRLPRLHAASSRKILKEAGE